MNEETTDSDTETLPLKVVGMESAHCAMTVEKVIKTLPGIESVDIDFSNQTAKVVFDPIQSTIEGITRVITDAGYEPIIQEEIN